MAIGGNIDSANDHDLVTVHSADFGITFSAPQRLNPNSNVDSLNEGQAFVASMSSRAFGVSFSEQSSSGYRIAFNGIFLTWPSLRVMVRVRVRV